MTGRRADLAERDSRIAQLAAEGLHADAIAHEVSVISRCLQGNPLLSDSTGVNQ